MHVSSFVQKLHYFEIYINKNILNEFSHADDIWIPLALLNPLISSLLWDSFDISYI